MTSRKTPELKEVDGQSTEDLNLVFRKKKKNCLDRYATVAVMYKQPTEAR